MKAGRLTCRALIASYLHRIETYDKNGPAINAIVLVNPEAEKEAAELDHPEQHQQKRADDQGELDRCGAASIAPQPPHRAAQAHWVSTVALDEIVPFWTMP